MRLFIITINYNNVEGLRHTLASVATQTYRNIEHIIIDGGSTDGSVEVIKEYVSANSLNDIWISEPDKGIYNAINKGIEIVLGRRVVEENHTSSFHSVNSLNESRCDYIQILNSGDLLAAPDVTERMVKALNELTSEGVNDKICVEILYGNMIKKDYETGKIIGKSGEVAYSLRQYYSGTLNHDCCYIRRDLFDQYGLYDESLKIVSDWKWFLQAIGLGKVKPKYVNIDVTIFDASGISEKNLALRNQERRQVLKEVLPPAVLADYDKFAFPMMHYARLKKHHLWGIVYFLERVLFKLEKWHVLR